MEFDNYLYSIEISNQGNINTSLQFEASTCMPTWPRDLVNTGHLFSISEYYNTLPTSSLFYLDLHLLYTTVRRQLFCVRSHHAASSRLIALLLLLGGIETNPGPPNGSCNGLRLGFINIRSAVNKSSIIQDIISSSRLDVLSICETWYNSDMPPAIVEGAIPKGYLVYIINSVNLGGVGLFQLFTNRVCGSVDLTG